MSVRWLVQTNLISNKQVTEFGQALLSEQIQFEEVLIIPFTKEIRIIKTPSSSIDRYLDDGTLCPTDFPNDVLIPYGSNKLVKLAYEQGLKTFFDPQQFRMDTWVKNRSDMLNSDCTFVRLKDCAKHLFSMPNKLVFIRPVEDLKAFPGTVTLSREFEPDTNLDSTLEIAICPVREISTEWRFFVVDGHVVCGSTYRIGGRLKSVTENNPSILMMSQVIADRWLPNPTCVMDLAWADNQFFVIEFNCLNCSGFYAHDLRKLVRAVTDYAQK